MKPTDYKHIKAWGKFLGSFDYYIEGEQQKAARENAPIDAIYKGDDGRWHTVDEIRDPHRRELIKRRALGYKD